MSTVAMKQVGLAVLLFALVLCLEKFRCTFKSSEGWKEGRCRKGSEKCSHGLDQQYNTRFLKRHGELKCFQWILGRSARSQKRPLETFGSEERRMARAAAETCIGIVQPQEIKDIKKFLEHARRKDAKCQSIPTQAVKGLIADWRGCNCIQLHASRFLRRARRTHARGSRTA